MIGENLQKQLKKAAAIVILLIAAVFAAGGVFSRYLARSREEAVRTQVIAETEEYKNRILKQLDGNFQTLTTLASFLDGGNTADRELLKKRLETSNRNNSFLTLVFCDTEGKAVITTYGKDSTANGSLDDLSAEGRRVMQRSLAGEAAVSRLFESVVTDSRVFVYSVPVYDGDEIIGALAASDHIEVFSDILSGNTVLGGGGYIHVLNSEGAFLLRSPYTVVSDDPASIFDGPYISPESREQIRVRMQDGERIFSSFRYEGRSYPFLLEPVGVNNWYLFCVNTGEGLIKSSDSSILVTQIVFAFILLLLAFLMLYGYRLFRRYNRRLAELAYSDPVTGAGNMTCFKERLPGALKDTGGAVVKFCVRQYPFLVEIFGSEKSTRFLCQIKETADRCFHSGEFFSHDTDDCFYFFLAETDKTVISDRLEAFLKELGHTADTSNTSYQLAFYCGVALCGGNGDPEENAELLMTHVQFALDKAKGAHSNFIWFFDSDLHKTEELENYIESHMHQALQDEEFRLFLQPKKDLRTGRLSGAEALVRWKPSDGRLLFPDQFIPLFERNGFCAKLDLYMFRQACRLIRSWIDQGADLVPVSVNQSKLVFFERDYVETLQRILEEYQVPAGLLILEILEGLALENADGLNERIARLKEIGFRISLDDFGSGYSSMNTLSRLDIDELKLDRGFLLSSGVSDRERSHLVMEQIIQLAHKLGVSTVAEGVETQEDEEFIRSIGCDAGQGYFYRPPVSVEEFNWLYMTQASGDSGKI